MDNVCERERERGGVPLSFPPELFEKDHLLKKGGFGWEGLVEKAESGLWKE